MENTFFQFITMPQILSQVFALGQILLALFLGGLLGLQRRRYGKPAGTRTYALVSAGAALFTVGANLAFKTSPEIARVTSQIVIGIGFIGAGTILRREDHIEGITTAAGLWFAAGIGTAVGLGLYIVATGAALVSLFILSIDDDRIPFGRKLKKKTKISPAP